MLTETCRGKLANKIAIKGGDPDYNDTLARSVMAKAIYYKTPSRDR